MNNSVTDSREKGLSLVELMVVVAITSILLLVAVPSFESFFGSLRDDRVIGDLEAALGLARSEAIKSGRSATVCAGTGLCSGATDWSSGWAVTLTGIGSVGDEVLRVWQDVPTGYSVTAMGDVRFRATGEIAAVTTQRVEVSAGEQSYCVAVGLLGNVSHQEGGC